MTRDKKPQIGDYVAVDKTECRDEENLGFLYDETVFRRVSDADDPRVLRRALEIAHKEIESINGNKYFPRETDPIESYIIQAHHELESEWNDDQS